MPESLDPAVYRDLIRRALAEDVGGGDVTTDAIVGSGVRASAVLLAKQRCVLAGLDIARDTFAQIDPAVEWTPRRRDGETCEPGDEIARLGGAARSLLTAERTALNLLQYLSGIATLTRRFVDAAEGRLVILDTRKTTPGLRALAKYAVRCGGARNHRVGLFDGVLIKDNHIRVAGSVAEAVRRVRATGRALPIEVEAQSDEEVSAAIDAGADIIMLDNLDDEAIAAAVRRIAGRARIEISGGMTLERVRALAGSGADYLSVGAITHSAPAADISLEIDVDVRPASR